MRGLICLLVLIAGPALADPVLAPGGTLRAVYIRSNLAQASADPGSGAITGVSADVARELGRRAGVPVVITPVESAQAVLAAVRDGTAEIGFVAPNPERVGVVLYSRPYMLVQQSLLVTEGSSIRSVAEIDRAGVVVGVNTGDSVGVWLKGRLVAARVVESADYTLAEAARWLLDGSVAGFAGNRQRLAAGVRGVAGVRMLGDNLYGVPQTVAVAVDRADRLAWVEAALAEMRESGFLERSVAGSGVDGIAVAPAVP